MLVMPTSSIRMSRGYAVCNSFIQVQICWTELLDTAEERVDRHGTLLCIQ